ncbi:hypothetical protein [Natrarchaeobius chitinivorans]|uniref:Uncharacterized protein n=1 Tax=Natrarchaeobius chitinivorans TaxID=1679083 RepID=A0A3N6N9C8_NATCH|nr:hypothetical protein [Natrarchaeobius chitinivorans]RQG95132.1 hypothetical protein EA473_09280 [Natrarchaeobius chitinivorans]
MVPEPPNSDEGLLISVDVLGAFGVTSTEIKRESEIDGPLEEVLAGALEDGRDRTSILRRMIARSNRGISCSARYTQESLERELSGVFEAVGWSFDCARSVARDRLSVSVVDHNGRRREATLEYPESPLGTDNLPAILAKIEETLLAGTGARFVLLSSGVDRWRGVLVDGDELADLRDRYGPRIDAVGRPLVPEDGLEAYVPDEGGEPAASGDERNGPWPAWASDRERDGTSVPTSDRRASTGSSQATLDDVASFIEEAESDPGSEGRSPAESEPENRGGERDRSHREPTSEPAWTASSDASGDGDTDGFELSGSPTVSRVSGADESQSASPTGGRSSAMDAAAGSSVGIAAGDSRQTDDGGSRSRRMDDGGSRSREATGEKTDEACEDGPSDSEEESAGFGTLSGTTKTARVSNDSFGSDVEWETEDDRYRALGMALGAGGAVSVEGVLDDDEFLPELPAVEPERTRIEFREEFDPTALPEAKATAEESGFVWMGSGSLETTRVSDG